MHLLAVDACEFVEMERSTEFKIKTTTRKIK